MTPVMLLSDGYIANGAEPWLLPAIADFKPIEVRRATGFNAHSDDADGEGHNVYWPYLRNENLARPWAIPGTPNLEHRIGGLEKAENTGNVCYDPKNHQRMIELRQAKVEKSAQDIPPTEIQGMRSGDALVIGWGGTYGTIHAATEKLLHHKHKIGTIHLRHLNPLPPDLGDIIKRFKKIIVPELNNGQLIRIIRDRYLVDARGINKIQGKPFLVSELVAEIESILAR